METTLLKRCAEWATSWWDKYRCDPFFRTTVWIICMQVVLTAALIGVFWVVLHLVEESLLAILVTTLENIVRGTETLTATEVLERITSETGELFVLAAAAIALLSILASVVIARLALAPVRRSLERQRLFVSNIAHELRTPLAVMRTSTEVSLLDSRVSPDIRETLETNLEELSRISEIINNLLSLSNSLRIDPVSFEAVNLGEVAGRAMSILSPLSERQGVTVTLHERMHAVAYGNVVALEQVVLNILKNAITWSGRNDTVEISVGPAEKGMVEIAIADHGVGIPKKDLPHVFEPFYRGDTSRARTLGKIGLGLTIAREIMTAHHGIILLQSKPNRGTTVVCRLPSAEDVRGSRVS